MKKNTQIAILLLAVATIVTGLTACSSVPASSEDSASVSTATMAESVTITDGWVRAVEDVSGVMPMTGFFMLVTNDSDSDVTIVGGSAAADLNPGALETHEVVKNSAGEMVMQEAKGGIVIPAHGSVKLMPGSFHIMLMNLLKPILPGDEVTISVEFADGSSADVTGVAYTIENGIEKYAPEASM